MRTHISRDNPFYHDPNFAFGYEHIHEGMRLLDYGCFNGRFGKELLLHKRVDYFGVDKNAEIVAQQDPMLQVSVVSYPLSFPDEHFDVIVLFEVLEHIADQERILRDLCRVLKQDGILIFSVPRKHIFSFLDMANWKFIFPKLHQLYYRINHSKSAYIDRYRNSPHGLVGDIEQEKRWHQHFGDDEMAALLNRSGFDVKQMDASGLFRIPMTDIGYVFWISWLFTQRIRDWDSYHFSSTQLICSAHKKSGFIRQS